MSALAEVIYTPRGDGRAHCRITGLTPVEAKAVHTFIQAAEPGARWEELGNEVESLDTSLSLEQIRILLDQALTPRPLGV